jgi:tetratricopeptide (TPR) repeat protein
LTGGGAVAWPAPVAVGQLLARRLARLSPAALKLARVAAIAGAAFSAPLAARVLKRDALDLVDAWSELEGAQVVRDNAFSHDLVLAAVREAIPAAVAAALHDEIAGHLGDMGAPARDLAFHWQAAGRWREAGKAFLSAADAALATVRRDDQLALLDHAHACFQRADDAEGAFAAAVSGAEAAMHVAGPQAALQRLQAVRGEAHNDARRLALARTEVDALLLGGQAAAALARAAEARTWARAVGAARDQVQMALRLAQAASYVGQGELALRALADADVDAVDVDTALRYELAAAKGFVVQRVSGHRAALPHLEEALQLCDRLGQRGEQVVALSNLAGVLGYLGQQGRAIELSLQAGCLRATLGQADGVAATTDLNLAGFLFAVGRYREALAGLHAVLATARDGGNAVWQAQAESGLAMTWLRLGQVQRAAATLGPPAAGLPGFVQARRLQVLAAIEHAMGRPAEVMLAEAVALAEQSGRGLAWLVLRADQCLTLRPQEAAALAEATAQDALQMDFPPVAALALARQAAALLAGNRATEAATPVRRAWALAREVEHGALYRPEVAWTAFRVLRAAGSKGTPPDEALQALHWGHAWLTDVALPQVPEEFRDSFLNRNPVNAEVLRAARQRLA